MKKLLFLLLVLISFTGCYKAEDVTPTPKTQDSGLKETLYAPYISGTIPSDRKLIVKEGQPITFFVSYHANPTPDIKVFHENVELFTSPYLQISYTETLIRVSIFDAYPEDAGSYIVKIENSEGSTSTIINVIVE